MADKILNPWLAENWNLTEQSLFIRRYGRIAADEAARAAGSFVGATVPPNANRRVNHTTIIKPTRNLAINQNRDVRTTGANAPDDGDVLTWDASALPAPGQWVPMPPSAGGGPFLKLDGTNSMLANLDFGGFRGVNADDPIDPQDLATKAYADSLTSTPDLTGLEFLVLAPDGSVPDARTFAAGVGLVATDAGAGGAYTLDVDLGVTVQAWDADLDTWATKDETNYVLRDGSRALTANWDVGSFELRAETFQSDVVTGTAPLIVDSTTLVTNLNADLVDGQHASDFATASHDHDAVYLRLDATNDPMQADLDLGANSLVGVNHLYGGGFLPNILILSPDQSTTLSGGLVRGVLFDPDLTSIDSSTWAAIAPMSTAGTVSLIGTTTSPTLLGVVFGGGGKVFDLSLTGSAGHFAQAFLFQHRATYRAATGTDEKIVVSSNNDEPMFRAADAGTALSVSYGGFISQPHYIATTGGATGVVYGTEGVNGIANFIARMQEFDTGWYAAERVGFFYDAPDSFSGGTIDDEYVLKTRTVADREPFLAPVGHRWLVHCDDTTAVIAHAGKTVFGGISGAPNYVLDVRGDVGVTDQLVSTLPDGTAPFVVASATLVANLNADTVDGQHAAAFALVSHNHDAGEITSGLLALARGGTNADLSGTGGTSRVLRQSSTGAAITVSQLAASDLSNGTIGSGAVVLADVLSAYALLAGRTGTTNDLTVSSDADGSIFGSAASGGSLKLFSTSHATKGKIFLGASSAYDAASIRLGIGTTSPTNGLRLETAVTSTATSGSLVDTRHTLTLDPASASTATAIGADIQVTTAATATDKGTNVWAARALVSRNATDTGSITAMVGFLLQASNSAPVSTGKGSIGSLTGGQFQAIDNSDTTVATTLLRGGNFQTNISLNTNAARVFTTVEAGYFTNSFAAGSTATRIVTNRVLNVDCATTGTLARTGTIDNAIGIDISGWTTAGVFGGGLTFTNVPEQVRLQSMSIAGSIAIRQQGTVPHNRFQGQVAIGADAAPTAYLHLAAAGTTAAGTAPLKLTSATSLMTAPEAGALEFKTDDFFATITTGAARKAFILDDGTRLTSGRVPFATTNGRLTDSSALAFAGSTLTTTGLVVGATGLTSYKGDATVRGGVASIVAVDGTKTDQTAAIGATTVYAVPASRAGMYRVSWVASINRAATTSSVLGGTNGFRLTYTRAGVAKTAAPTTVSAFTSTGNATTTSCSGVFIAECDASTNLQYQYDYTSVGGTTMRYDLLVMVEYLG